jgi:hypothetical protein
VWAAVGIVACLVLALTAQESHPPAVILLPLALVVWAVGHGLIWGVLRLVARGQRGARTATDAQPWPLVLRLAVVSTGAPALAGVVQVVGTVVAGRLYPFHHAGDWAAVLVVWLVHAACFAGLLLRQGWSRLMSATLAFGWASLLGVQVAEHLGPGRPSGGTDILVALVLMALLFALGICLVSSRKARLFLAR